MGKQLIGLSVSLCIADIIRGQIKLENVGKIIGSIRARNDEAWDGIIQKYRQTYWAENPDKGEKICRQLITEGLIEQPRLSNNNKFPIIGKSRWVKSEREIEWNQV